MLFFEHFWAPRNAFEPVGMFTRGHMFLLLICLSILLIMLYASRKFSKDRIEKITKVLAIVMVTLESIKICYSFYWGYIWLSAWFPIAFCSIFMYALLLRGYGKGKWRDMGESFLGGACIAGGTAFLLFPSTSLMMYPVFHYQCLYSMFFHTLMIYTGIMYLWKMEVQLNKIGYKHYVKIYTFFAAIAIVLNTIYESNLMLLRDPFNIPIPFVHKLVQDSPWIYTVVVFLAYLLLPYWMTAYIVKRVKKRYIRFKNNGMDEISV